MQGGRCGALPLYSTEETTMRALSSPVPERNERGPKGSTGALPAASHGLMSSWSRAEDGHSVATHHASVTQNRQFFLKGEVAIMSHLKF